MKKIIKSDSKGKLATFIEEVLADSKYVLEDKTLVDMATYTLKKFKEKSTDVLKVDLWEVAKELQDYITPEQEELKPVEAKLKPVKKEVEEPAEEVEKPKAVKKAKAEPKTVEKVQVVLPKNLDLDVGNFTLNEDIQSISDLEEAIENGREFVIAEYWSKKLLKQYSYGTSTTEYASRKEFPLDFDISQPIYISEDKLSLYAYSIYEDKMGRWKDEDFEVIDHVRYCNFAEWGLYENLEVEEEESDIEEVEEVEEK